MRSEVVSNRIEKEKLEFQLALFNIVSLATATAGNKDDADKLAREKKKFVKNINRRLKKLEYLRKKRFGYKFIGWAVKKEDRRKPRKDK